MTVLEVVLLFEFGMLTLTCGQPGEDSLSDHRALQQGYFDEAYHTGITPQNRRFCGLLALPLRAKSHSGQSALGRHPSRTQLRRANAMHPTGLPL